MSKTPFKATRNKSVISDVINCPYCHATLYYEVLKNADCISKYENTEIITCHMCDGDFVKSVTKDIEYKYSGHCKRKDGK